jgi:hypothetical protein
VRRLAPAPNWGDAKRAPDFTVGPLTRHVAPQDRDVVGRDQEQVDDQRGCYGLGDISRQRLVGALRQALVAFAEEAMVR